MRRALAVLGAVAIVVAAVIVRGIIDDDGEAARPDPSGDGRVALVCDVDFENECAAWAAAHPQLDIRVEDSAITSAAIVGGEADEIDVWLTSDTWWRVTEARAGGERGESTPVASTDIGVAALDDRVDRLAALCGEEPVWACLLQSAGQTWGSLGGEVAWGALEVGLPSADTATGLSVLTSIAVGHFGGADFASNDFPSLQGPLATLVEPSGDGDAHPLRTMLVRRGEYSAAAALGAQVKAISPLPAVLATSPPVGATAVLVDLAGGDDPPAAGALADAFRDARWTTPPQPSGALPAAPVIGALHDLWTEARR